MSLHKFIVRIFSNTYSRSLFVLFLISSEKPEPTPSVNVNLIMTTFPCRNVSEETQSAEVLAMKLAVNLPNLGSTLLHGF